MTDLRPRKPKRKLRNIVVAAGVVLLVLGTGAFTFRGTIRDIVDQVTGAEYSGSGTGSVTLVVKPGETGREIASDLIELGITKSFDVTLRKIYAADPMFYPGSFELPMKISTPQALQILTNPENIKVNRVVIPEGLRMKSVFKILSLKTGIPTEDFEKATSNPKDYGVSNPAGSLEGYLFPATYDFDPKIEAAEVIEIMVNRTKQQLEADGVAKKDWHKTLTLASVIQSEARLTEDFYKVSRVFQNRIAVGMPLQSDATVNYGVGSEDIYTSDAERADPNKYNTYLYRGLPIGPIAGSGALAIDAVLNPAEGKWLYFCTVNLKTGETVFSNTYSEHLKAVSQWLKWMKENPGWDD